MRAPLWLAAAALALAPCAAMAQNRPTVAPTVNAAAVITTGGTFQTVLAASNNRRSITIQNNNATDSCWVYVGSGSATAGKSILLLAGGSYTRYFPYLPNDAIQATCASNSDTLYVDTQ